MSVWLWKLSEILSKPRRVKDLSCQLFELRFFIPFGGRGIGNVFKNYVRFTGVEEKCIGQFKLIFSLLRMSEATKLQQLALEVRDNSIRYLCYQITCTR